ncbi:hypothetical protein B1690_02420 [Geobacillus sp. 46C-IIa]|uniref:hypothetical protein n=1 Tax=Geobacillus sp. 46C-IIa TaxID=1963025 RepID=UPI0009BCA953|nr:hypothetical protein [Geobacillus sp. 46C-IIa]OQP07406.1 hypothetical protein B1690_02420 [Geobacillus sp. 46C-IIa]QNU28424.1 hypothetical protein IC803_02290 [Geobacillus sp. 46C-IIa]
MPLGESGFNSDNFHRAIAAFSGGQRAGERRFVQGRRGGLHRGGAAIVRHRHATAIQKAGLAFKSPAGLE